MFDWTPCRCGGRQSGQTNPEEKQNMNTTEEKRERNELPASVLTAKQVKTWRKEINRHGSKGTFTVEARHDDQCRNGHNSFAITAEFRRPRANDCDACGCMHDEVAEHFPGLAPLIRWHLTSTDGPMHYIANTVYHVEQGKLDYARSSAVWPEATDEELLTLQREGRLSTVLRERLPALMAEFKTAVDSLGFVY